MKAIYIYNPYSALEVQMIDRAKSELSNYVESVEAVDFLTAKEVYSIRATPALIIIRDDLQGEHLLDEENGQLRITAELYKVMEEEERNIHQAETHRIDNIIIAEKSAAQDDLLMDLLNREVI